MFLYNIIFFFLATHYAAYFSFEEVFQKTELRLEWTQQNCGLGHGNYQGWKQEVGKSDVVTFEDSCCSYPKVLVFI
jgi:hypothetical protein